MALPLGDTWWKWLVRRRSSSRRGDSPGGGGGPMARTKQAKPQWAGEEETRTVQPALSLWPGHRGRPADTLPAPCTGTPEVREQQAGPQISHGQADACRSQAQSLKRLEDLTVPRTRRSQLSRYSLIAQATRATGPASNSTQRLPRHTATLAVSYRTSSSYGLEPGSRDGHHKQEQEAWRLSGAGGDKRRVCYTRHRYRAQTAL
jgi:hypothetical protein